jgi:hypothetical protein
VSKLPDFLAISKSPKYLCPGFVSQRCLGRGGITTQSLLNRGQRCARETKAHIRRASTYIGEKEIRIETECLIISRYGLLKTPELQEYLASVEIRIGIAWIKLKSSLNGPHSFLVTF